MLFYLYMLLSLPFTRRRGVVSARRYFEVLETSWGEFDRRTYIRRLKLEAYWTATFGPPANGRHDESGRHSRADLFGFILRIHLVPLRQKGLIIAMIFLLALGETVSDRIALAGRNLYGGDKVYNLVRYGTNERVEIDLLVSHRVRAEFEKSVSVETLVREVASDVVKTAMP